MPYAVGAIPRTDHRALVVDADRNNQANFGPIVWRPVLTWVCTKLCTNFRSVIPASLLSH